MTKRSTAVLALALVAGCAAPNAHQADRRQSVLLGTSSGNSPKDGRPPVLSPNETRPLNPGESRLPSAQLRWQDAPAPAGSATSIAAIAAAKQNAVRPEQLTQQPTHIRSGKFSSDVLGDIQRDGSVNLKFVDVPAWVLEYDGLPVVSYGPVAAPKDATCPLYVFIRASDAAFLMATQECGVEQG